MENINKTELKQNIIRIGKGCIFSIVLTIFLLFIFSILLTYTGLQENIMKPVVIVITAISILVGSSISTLKISKNGILNGAMVGLIYILTIYLLSAILGSGFLLQGYSIIMMIASVIAGMIGGIIGVNL